MMRQDELTLTPGSAAGGRGEGPPVILSGDHAGTGHGVRIAKHALSLPKGNLGWGERSVSQQRGAAGDLKVSPYSGQRRRQNGMREGKRRS